MSRLEQVFYKIDEINEQDPNLEQDEDGQKRPKELIYGQRMTAMLQVYDQSASELVSIAARGQHVERWSIPRESYPMDRKGYLKWRTVLKLKHAEILEGIMAGLEYSEEEINHVKTMITKNKLKSDPDSQVLEDVVCLVFLKYYFGAFAQKHPEPKLIDILQKTWGKMTEKGRGLALGLPLTKTELELIQKALN